MPGVWIWSGSSSPDLDQFLDFGDGDLAARRDHRIEVARSLAIDEVAGRVALPGLDDGEVGGMPPPARTRGRRTHACPCPRRASCRGRARVEARDSGAAGAQLLGERALRRQLRAPVRRPAPGARIPCSRRRSDAIDFLHLPGLEQQAHAEVVDARIVADDRQALRRLCRPARRSGFPGCRTGRIIAAPRCSRRNATIIPEMESPSRSRTGAWRSASCLRVAGRSASSRADCRDVDRRSRCAPRAWNRRSPSTHAHCHHGEPCSRVVLSRIMLPIALDSSSTSASRSSYRSYRSDAGFPPSRE